MKTEILLSDEFVSFSSKVSQLFQKKKAEEAEFKNTFSEYKLRIKAIEEEVSKLKKDFDDWASTQS